MKWNHFTKVLHILQLRKKKKYWLTVLTENGEGDHKDSSPEYILLESEILKIIVI